MSIKPFITVTSTTPLTTHLQVTCSECGEASNLGVLTEGFESWRNGGLIQSTMPELTIGERELLISGVCGLCFDKMFPDDEEDSL